MVSCNISVTSRRLFPSIIFISFTIFSLKIVQQNQASILDDAQYIIGVSLPKTLNDTFFGHKLSISLSFSPELTYRDGVYFMPTGENITAKAHVHGHTDGANLTFQWSEDNQVIVTNNMSERIIKKDKPMKIILKVLVMDDKSRQAETEVKLDIKIPVKLTSFEGKQHMYHDDLLDWTFHYDGTGPFHYCYKISFKGLNCSPIYETNENHLTTGPNYLPYIDDYILFIYITNYAGPPYTNTFSISIEETVKKPKILYVPIVSSIIAVLILLTGVALHFRFRKRVGAETADFDFTRNAYENDEWDEEQTFGERVRYLLFGSQPEERRGLFSYGINRSRTSTS